MVPDALTGGPHFAAYCERYIRHTKGRWAGRPLVYEEWQREFWWEALEFDPATGLRIYNEIGLGIPRKNTKSTMASAAGLYMLDADGEPEPEVYVAAAARNQAGIVLGQARSMVNRSPLLLDRLVPHRYTIECPRNGGIMRSLSSDAALQHGLNPSANIVDELHAHKSSELYTALTTGTGAREQPFTLWITTAGVAGEGILAELYESMFSGTGELEDRGSLLVYRDRVNGTLIYWYGAPRDADIEDPAVWFAANPVSWLHDGKYLSAQFARLRARGALLEWRRYHLNQFVGIEDAWLRDGAWRDTTGDLPLNAALPIGVGIDRSPSGEQGAIAIAQRQGDRVVVRAQVFPAESATGMASSEAMRAQLRELRAEYPLPQARDERTKRALPGPAFAYDRQAFGESAEMLEGEGLNMVEVPMTAAVMGPPSTLAYELITTGRLVHEADPILAEHVANTTAVLTDRGMKVTRSKHGSTRPNVAAVAMARTPEEWLTLLNRRLIGRQGAMALYENYYDGQHRATFILARLLEAFGRDFRDLRINYCSVVVDALNERLNLDGFLLGSDARASAAAWEIWQRSGMDDEFSRGTRSALVKSEFGLIVWPDATGEPRLTVEDGAQLVVAVDPADKRVRRAALKRWYDEDERRTYATLYLPEGIFKYQSTTTQPEAGGGVGELPGAFYRGGGAGPAGSAPDLVGWAPREVAGEPWPLPNPFLEVPVFALPNRPNIAGLGSSELRQIVPIQDALNANLVNVMLAGQYGAFRQKWATNVRLEVDEATGKPKEPWAVAVDSIFTAPPPEAGEPETRFGEFAETSLEGYVKLHEAYVQGIATISRTPPHYFLGSSGSWPSGESLRSAEAGLTKKAGERASDFGDPLEAAMRLAFRIKASQAGVSNAARNRYLTWAAAPLRAHWTDPETRTESEHIDALTKMLALRVPAEAIWARIPASPQEIATWKQMQAPPDVGGAEGEANASAERTAQDA